MSLRRTLAASALVVAVALSGCGGDGDGDSSTTDAATDAATGTTIESTTETTAPLLNSERIEQRFGSYGIEVIAQDDATRVSDLYSGDGADRVTRTLAVVSYPSTVDAAFADEHAAIVSGGSIGSTFRDAGWTIDKRDVYVGSADGADVPAQAFDSMGIDEQTLALHVYRFDVSRDGVTYEYATIAEFHHPDYLAVDELRSIFGDGEVTELDRGELDRLSSAAPQPVG